MRTKELRLALVCSGGVSLAVYMHGLTKEVWKLSRASMRRRHPDAASLPPADDSEAVYLALLEHLPGVDLRVMVDIIAGTSAGGINGIQLARAVVEGHDLEAATPLWLDSADSDVLLDPAGAARPWSKLWALPLIWWVRRRGLAMADRRALAGQAEVKAKLSRLMRSRWFHPPFSGASFTRLLLEAFEAMAAGTRTPPLLPALHPFDLFVTVTDYHGAPETLRLNTPAEVVEAEHRLVMAIGCPGDGAARHLGDDATLALAARATASFPGAFPPATVGEIDAALAARGQAWPNRNATLARLLPGHPQPETAVLLDGAVLDNRPFGPALAALGSRPAHREVERRFLYIDPKPGQHDGSIEGAPLPGFFTTILKSLSDIPRQQPIKDNIAAIDALSQRLRRLRHIVVAMLPEVDAAIDAAIGIRLLLLSPTPERLADWRSRLNGEAAKRSGFAFGAYGRVKLARIVEAQAGLFSQMGGGPLPHVRASLWRLVRDAGLDVPAVAQGKAGAQSDYVLFLRKFDLEFRIRRLRFVIRRLNQIVETAKDANRPALERTKAGLYAVLAPLLERRRPGWFAEDVLAAARDVQARPGQALDALAAALDLKALDAATDAGLAQVLSQDMPRALRKALLSAYLGFPFFDIAVLPLLAEGDPDELDEVKIDRLSPEDCTGLGHIGGQALQGARFNAFGAFFSRAYREHDYLWGRLHATERLIDMVVACAGKANAPAPDVLARIKRNAFAAIVVAETPRLQTVPELLAALLAELTPPETPAGAAQTAADNG